MTKEAKRAGANPVDPDTPQAAFSLSSLMEAQLTEGLALLRHAADIAGGGDGAYYTHDRNGAMSAAARLMLANSRAAETLARLKEDGGKETVYRQIVEVKHAGNAPGLVRKGKSTQTDEDRFVASRELYLSLRPPAEEVEQHEALEAARIAEGRPIDENTWWLRRHQERIPFWAELEQSIEDEKAGGGTPA